MSVHASDRREPAAAAATRTLSANPPAITLRGVTKRYGTHLALQPTDLEIAEGEFFCLLGPSGCGKTTTLNLIGGFVAPVERRDLHPRRAGRPAAPAPAQRQHRLPVVRALPAHDACATNVGFGLKMARVPSSRVGSSNRRGAGARRARGASETACPAQLSGGQQQRVAVARALVNRPAVLLLDEPLGALDLKLRKRLQVELAQIHRDVGTTFVYVTHDQEEAMSMATRIAVMNDGRIEQIGTPERDLPPTDARGSSPTSSASRTSSRSTATARRAASSGSRTGGACRAAVERLERRASRRR